MRHGRFGIAASAVCFMASLAISGSAQAAPDEWGHDIGGRLPSHLAGENTVVHYSSRPEHAEKAITEAMAARVLEISERAFAAMRAAGLPPHLPDADGKVDFYIWEWPINSGDAITKSDDPAAPRATSHVKIDADSFLRKFESHPDFVEIVEETIAHELVHVAQDSTAQYQGTNPDMWMLAEGTASAFSGRVVGPGSGFFAGPLHAASLDETGYAYQSWLFFESVIQDYGAGTIFEIYEGIGAGLEPLAAIDAMLARHGSSLAAAYTTFANRYAAGAWASPLASTYVLETPPENRLKLPRKTPKETVKLKGADVTLNHLAIGLVSYEPGRQAAKCEKGKLTITATLPSGASGGPSLLVNGATSPFRVSGSKATISRRWAPCKDVGTVVLANGSSTADGLRYAIGAKFKP
jgi:hypothetical protein